MIDCIAWLKCQWVRRRFLRPKEQTLVSWDICHYSPQKAAWNALARRMAAQYMDLIRLQLEAQEEQLRNAYAQQMEQVAMMALRMQDTRAEFTRQVQIYESRLKAKREN